MAVSELAVMKLLYIVVVEDDHDDDDNSKGTTTSSSFRYTRSILQSTLQFMGCKARHAFKISRRVFEVVGGKSLSGRLVSAHEDVLPEQEHNVNHGEEYKFSTEACFNKENVDNLALQEDRRTKIPFELYKRRTTLVVKRSNFLDVVCGALSEYKYVGPNQRADLVLACRLRERKESVTILLCGTSGCGKSTLSALLGSRLGITTVISTDSIRHMMRSFVDEKENPLLWASTYHAGEYLDPVAVAEAKAKRKAKKSATVADGSPTEHNANNNCTTGESEGNSTSSELLSPKQMAVEGYKAQSEMVIDSLDRLITSWEERKESVVVEGVHLSLNFVMGLMKKHPSIMPFMIYIANEEKHLERFAVRAKYMTLDPAKNKYVKYIRNIRTIQEYLCNHADKHLVPKINNTNVDKSVAVIHATVFSCLRRLEAGDQLYDPVMNRVTVIEEEYRSQCAANSLSSKGMFQLIQGQDSNRQLMALFNNDGSVAKVWPLDMVDDDGKPIVVNSLYGSLQVGKAERVNLQFGNFGISAWPSDTGGTSHASSMDESKGELTDNGSRHFSSCCSSPKGLAKELKEENSVHGSDEEVDETSEVDSDADFSDGREQFPDELEGSVDEESTKSDEEYDDLAMQDTPQNGYATENDEAFKEGNSNNTISPDRGNKTKKNVIGEKRQQKLDSSQRTKSEPLLESLMRAFGFPPENKKETPPESSGSRAKMRSQSISSLAWLTNKWSNKEALSS